MTDLMAIAEAIAADSSCAQGEFHQRVLAILPYLTAIEPKPFNAVRELNEFVSAALPTPQEKDWSDQIRNAAARHVVNNAIVPPADDESPTNTTPKR